MTLNVLERRNRSYFAFFFTEFDCSAGQLIRHSGRRWACNVRKIFVSQFQSSTFGHNEHTLQHDLSVIAELLVLHITNL